MGQESLKQSGRKLNCWEVLRCGREVGGATSGQEACPAATDTPADGVNSGKNAGRICWTVAGTFCFGHRQPSVPRKRSLCQLCPFFRRVKQEEGRHFQLIRLASPPLSEKGQGEESASLRRVTNNLARLLTVCQDIIRHAELNALLRAIAEQACRACDAERGIVYILDPAQEQLVAKAMSGPGVTGVSVPIADNSVGGYVAKHNTFINVFDTSEELSYIFPELRTDRSFWERYGFPVRNVLAVPIQGERESSAAATEEATPAEKAGDIIGVIEVLNKRDGHFTEDDEWFLAEVAIIAGLVLQSAQLSRQLSEMRRTDQEKSRFVALLMHQIISPLATAYTCVSTLAKLGTRIAAQDRDALMQGTLDKVVMVQELARKLLDLTAIQDGRALADCKTVDLVAVIRAEVENHSEAASARNIRLLADLPATPHRVHGDPMGLGIIFANLLENAVKYSRSGTDVLVSGRVEDGTVFAGVRDHGPGISDKDLDRLFDEFYRCADAAKKGIAGSGLGLAFVKALVTRYGGSVHVDSRVGEGSTFTVSFPCV